MTMTLATEPTPLKIKRSLSAEEREAHVKAWQMSGLTMSAYCRAHGLAISSLSVWVSKSKGNKSVEGKRFFPVKRSTNASTPTATSQSIVKITLANGIAVQLQTPLSLQEVVDLAKELSRCN